MTQLFCAGWSYVCWPVMKEGPGEMRWLHQTNQEIVQPVGWTPLQAPIHKVSWKQFGGVRPSHTSTPIWGPWRLWVPGGSGQVGPGRYIDPVRPRNRSPSPASSPPRLAGQSMASTPLMAHTQLWNQSGNFSLSGLNLWPQNNFKPLSMIYKIAI